MPNAENLAAAYDEGTVEPAINGHSGKHRTKHEQDRLCGWRLCSMCILFQVEHKHPHPEGNTHKMVQVAMNGEEKRKKAELHGHGPQTRLDGVKKEKSDAEKQ